MEKEADTPILVLGVGSLVLVILVSISKNERIKPKHGRLGFVLEVFKDKQWLRECQRQDEVMSFYGALYRLLSYVMSVAGSLYDSRVVYMTGKFIYRECL